MRIGRLFSLSSFLSLILLAGMLTITCFPSSQANPATTVYVDPPSTVMGSGESISVNVSVADVADLYVWGFKIYYLNSILTGITDIEGPFLASGGPTSFYEIDFNNNYNATHGLVWLACTLLGSVPGVTGSGVLATITFRAVGVGNTTLSLPYTVLGDSNANAIPYTTNDGTVRVTGTIDIAVTGVTPLKTVVGQRYNMGINVTVKNQGDQTTTFNVTTYANNSAVSTVINTSLLNGGSTILTFTWNTSGFAKGNYTISAYAWPVPGETNTANNNLTGGWVIVAMVGDITGPTAGVPDGKVDIRDIHLVAVNFGKTVPPGPSNCDITGPIAGVPDGKVDIRDLSLVAKSFGKIDP